MQIIKIGALFNYLSGCLEKFVIINFLDVQQPLQKLLG